MLPQAQTVGDLRVVVRSLTEDNMSTIHPWMIEAGSPCHTWLIKKNTAIIWKVRIPMCKYWVNSVPCPIEEYSTTSSYSWWSPRRKDQWTSHRGHIQVPEKGVKPEDHSDAFSCLTKHGQCLLRLEDSWRRSQRLCLSSKWRNSGRFVSRWFPNGSCVVWVLYQRQTEIPRITPYGFTPLRSTTN